MGRPVVARRVTPRPLGLCTDLVPVCPSAPGRRCSFGRGGVAGLGRVVGRFACTRGPAGALVPARTWLGVARVAATPRVVVALGTRRETCPPDTGRLVTRAFGAARVSTPTAPDRTARLGRRIGFLGMNDGARRTASLNWATRRGGAARFLTMGAQRVETLGATPYRGLGPNGRATTTRVPAYR